MFNGFKKAELANAARVMHVDFDANATVEEIKAAIIDAGKSEEDYYNAIGERKEYSDQPRPTTDDDSDEARLAELEAADEEPAADEAPAADEEPAEEKKVDNRIVARFLGNNLIMQTKWGKFSRTRPVFVTTQDKLDAVMQKYPGKFRKATKAEAELLR